VADLACRIGERMGLQARQVLRLAQAAVLHDVGKIGVADNVLHKPGGLDEVEKAQMRQHAEKGYRILSAAPHLHGVAELVYAHHEWYDGTGYPRGLQGDQIPLEARIFAVADVFDALTSDRPYRRAMNRDEALRIIQEQRGRHFDPEVVRVFLAVLRERTPPADQDAQTAN
jgi:HD-GYP domain-containing protein (c-di-GMP phosphodiesterase class II)